MSELRCLFLRIVSVACGCCVLASAAALELGDMTVNSEVGRLLDARVALNEIDFENLEDWYVIVAGRDDYHAQDLEYRQGLHDRLVMEIVTSANPPYIALSSLAIIKQPSFDLIVRIANRTDSLFRAYNVVLKEAPPPVSAADVVMTPAEMLNYLTKQLAASQDITAAVVWGELQTLLTDVNSGGEYKFMLYLSAIHLEPRFIAGIRTLLSEQQAVIFDKVAAESGIARAAASVLFGQRDFLVIKELLSKATEHSLAEGNTKSQQLAFAKERAAILENKLHILEYSNTKQNAPAQRRTESETGKDTNEKSHRPHYGSRLDYRYWLDYFDWGEKPLESNAKIWIAIASLMGVLLLLSIVYLFRMQKEPPPPTSARVGRVALPLPGQIELEKLRPPQVYIDPLDEDGVMTAKLNRAAAYIEMRDPEAARGLLEEVAKQSKDPKHLERVRDLQDKVKQ